MFEVFPNNEVKKDIPFEVNYEWNANSLLEYHHEPKLAEKSRELINQAVEVNQDDYAVLGPEDKERFLKTYGVGPCIILIASNPSKQQLGVIHFDAGSNVKLLINNLRNSLNVNNNFNNFNVKLIGGIEGIAGSEELKKEIDSYCESNNIKITNDKSMMFKESDYKGLYEDMAVFMLGYQSLIIDKNTGETLSF